MTKPMKEPPKLLDYFGERKLKVGNGKILNIWDVACTGKPVNDNDWDWEVALIRRDTSDDYLANIRGFPCEHKIIILDGDTVICSPGWDCPKKSFQKALDDAFKVACTLMAKE